MHNKAKRIKAAKLLFSLARVRQGGDNFKFIGIGRVGITLIGRPRKFVAKEQARKEFLDLTKEI